jgi:hypothetical protein
VAVDGRHDRFGQIAQGANQRGVAVLVGLRDRIGARRQVPHAVEVVAGAERPSVSLEQDASDGVAARSIPQSGTKALDHLVGECVQLLRAVQPQRHDPVGAAHLDGTV